MNARLRPNVVNGLHWVRGEIEQSLSRVRALIEQYIESPNDALPLQQSFVELHQVRGTAGMIQCHGLAELAEEMKQTLADLMHGRIREVEAAYSALLGATVLLNDYIEALSDGMDDCALILQPALNELRLARGKSVLTEADLFAAQLQSLNFSLPMPDEDARTPGAAEQQAQKYLGVFQASLLHWLRGQADAATALARIGKVSELLASCATESPVHQLWRVMAAAVEAMLGNGMEDSLELKRLFGRAGAQIKLLASEGESAAAPGAAALSYQLLYFVGRSRGQGPRVTVLRKAFQLQQFLPSAAQLDELRRRLHGPNTTLLERVSEEIRNDFARIKDVIDLAVRTGGKGAADFEVTRASLKRIGDTLSVLGLAALQRVVGNQVEMLDRLTAQATPAPAQWMELATSILRVEHSLEDALFHQMRESRATVEEITERVPHSRDLAEGIAALYRESLVNLARLKSSVDAHLRGQDGASLLDAARLMEEIASAFRILQVERAAQLAGQLAAILRGPSFESVRESKERADRFADAIASIEYYLEAIRDDLPDAGFLLDNLAKFVEQLDVVPAAPPAETLPDLELEPLLELNSLADLVLSEPASPAQPAVETASPEPAIEAPAAPAPLFAAPNVVEASDVDPEIREVFLDEAAEVLQTLQTTMPRWTRDPADRESLTTLRRAFHTLKGSGRMVGATQIGEFGWAFENLLNKCLDGSIAVSTPVVATANEAVALLPELIELFRNSRPPSPTLTALVDRAQNLAAGRGAEQQPEPDLAAIFREDAREKLAEVQQWLGALDRSFGEFPVDDGVVRAYHTLRGAGHIVSAEAISDLSGALEAHLDSVRSAELRLSSADIDLLEAATRLLTLWVEQVGTPALQAQDAAPWLQRIEQINAHVPDHAVQAAEDRQLAEIFSGEALELVQKFEETALAWAQAPDNRQAPHDLKVVLHTLKGAAYMSNCPAIGNVAKAFHARMEQCIAEGIVPDQTAFDALASLTEGLYQQLDAYRDGRLRDDGSGLVAGVEAFAWRSDGSVPVTLAFERPAPAVAVAAPTVEPAAPEVIEAAVEPAVEAVPMDFEEVIEMPDVEVSTTGSFEVPETDAPIRLDASLLAFDSEPAAAAQPVELPLADFDRVEPGEATPADPFADAQEPAIEMPEVEEPTPEFVGDAGFSLPPMPEARTDTESPVASFAAIPVPGELSLQESAPAAEPIVQDFEQDPELPTNFDLPAQDSPMPVQAVEPDTATEPAAAPQIETVIEIPEVAIEGTDAELLGVFLIEAEELLEALDRSSSALERNLRDAGAVADMKRVLHTLKGSARMAGLADIGQVGHQLESMFEAVERGQLAADGAFFARLHAASDGLHLALDDLRRGRVPDLQSLLLDIGGESVPVSDAFEPSPELMPAAIPEAPASAPSPPFGGDITPTPESLRNYDAELGAIFSAEAAELLETLDASLKRWRTDPQDPAPMRDIQRALHTFKGGARMAGLNAMGDLVHDVETRVNRVEAGLDAVGPAVLSALEHDVEALHRMHDLLERGDIASLLHGEDSAAKELAAELPPAALESNAAPRAPNAWDPLLFWRPDDEGDSALRRETARVPVEALDAMLNEAGEISIYRSRLDEHNASVRAQLNEMTQAIARIRDQLRQLDAETDAQIAARGLGATEQVDRYATEFDPLEMDRYTRMQELSRALSESVGDLANLQGTIEGLTSEAETLLMQQGRVNTEVQQGLMRTLMVPFSRQLTRLQRVVRQTAAENGKLAEVVFSGAESELDRNVLERMTAPLEHLLRNSIVHGIEDPQSRAAAGKPELGRINVNLWREGSQLLVELRDDGRGLDFPAIRATAIKRGLMPADAEVTDDEIAQFIFQPGFSTARKLTQDAGRGIGMDVVASEVKQLGGTLELASETGRGARFLVRLPLNLAMSQALLIGVGHEQYAIPLPSIEGIARIPREQLDDLYSEDGPSLTYGGGEYRVYYLGDFVGTPRDRSSESRTVSAILVRLGEGLVAGERRIAVVVDQLFGNREIVSKAVGPQISSIAGVTGATILADGRVVLILDPASLAQDRARRMLISLAAGKADAAVGEDERELIMVVDDSITIRRVTERLLLKQGYRVITAKDGLDAMAQLQTEQPSAILLDIEMPRADGFEVAAFVRNSDRIARTPIIMITSRSGEKHRERARSIGVDRYLIKPFQEDQLVGELRGVLQERMA